MQQGNKRAIIAALLANAGIAVAKFVGFIVTGAASMQAEAVHSLADSGNQALLLWGGASARKEASTDHPFGYGKERFFWSFVVALVLFSMGALFAIYPRVPVQAGGSWNRTLKFTNKMRPLILNEIVRVVHFTYVMIVSHNLTQ